MTGLVLAASQLLVLPTINPLAVRIYTLRKGLEADHVLMLLESAVLPPAVLECRRK